MPNYWVWTDHGKVVAGGNQFSIGYVGDNSGGGMDMGDRDMGHVNWEDNVNRYQEMVSDAAGPEFGMCSQSSSEVPNLEA